MPSLETATENPENPGIDPILLKVLDAVPFRLLTDEGVAAARQRLRDLPRRPMHPELRVEDRAIAGPGGPIGIRIYWPSADPGRRAPVVLFFHGGGFVVGDLDTHDGTARQHAVGADAIVVSVEYRLAPEHPYPAAPDDCEDAALWLLRHGLDELGLPPVVTIGGDSAGAHLSAVTLLRLRDRHGIDAVRAANLVYGAFDLALTPSQRNWGERNLILTTPIIRWFGDQFLPGVAADARRDPDISPLYAELHGLPPALFTVGTLDPLLDDSLFMEARWRAAGNHGELRVWPEAIHGFNAFPLAVTAAAREAQYAFLRGAVGGA
jgi:acetyl esterase/lipase